MSQETIRIRHPRHIIDRKAVVQRLDDLAKNTPSTKLRREVLALMKEVMAHGRAEVRRRFEEKEANGIDVTQANCYLIDQIIRAIHDFAAEKLHQGVKTAGEQLCIAAVGGYGRGELSPHSDIDLLFLLPFRQTPYIERLVEYILYMLWDLGLTVGHATRSVEECIYHAKGDITIRTALLEARYLWGEEGLFRQLKERFRAEVVANSGEAFIEAKLSERDERHNKMGDTRYVLEPNVKDGKGGLRDLHTLVWIAKYIYPVENMAELAEKNILPLDTVNKFIKAHRFLTAVRCHLHYLRGREEDRLTFDVQKEIASRMGYADRHNAKGVERFMKHYFIIAKNVGDLTRIFCALLEEQNKRKPKINWANLPIFKKQIEGLRLEGNRLNLNEEELKENPLRILKIFSVAQESNCDLHPNALKVITENLGLLSKLRDDPRANQIFLQILLSAKGPETALRSLSEAGVFGRFIPDFGRVTAQMQYDMYHVYTVDEHTIRAIGILHQLERGDFAKELSVPTEAFRHLDEKSRRVLYVATLMHDIAKGRHGDHSVLGAEVALKLAPRLGLGDDETESVSFLVRNHLAMSHAAFKRDVDDPKTIIDFTAKVQSPERLRMLLLLTIADIKAVGPTVWNAWKAGLLRELYLRCLENMAGGLITEGKEARVTAAKRALKDALEGWAEEDIEAHLQRGYPHYWLSFDTKTQVRHAHLIREAERERKLLVMDHHIDHEHNVTEITIYADDHPGIFAQIAGAMAICGASILDAKIITMTNGMVLDTFWIQEAATGVSFDHPEKLVKLTVNIEQALSGRLNLDKEIKERRTKIPAKTEAFTIAPVVNIDNNGSRTHTLIEINGRDRPGFLYDITSTITKNGLQISSARIATYGERVVDTFYVKDIFGMKIDSENKLKEIRRKLKAAIAMDEK